MTHTMHRRAQNQGDYIIHIRASGGTMPGSGAQITRCLDALLPLQPVAFGSGPTGSTLGTTPEAILAKMRDGVPFHVTFSNEKAFREALRRLHALDTGLCVVVAAPEKLVADICKEEGLELAGVHLDLGIFAPPELLRENPWIGELLSLCGHLRVSPILAQELLEDVRRQKRSPEQAARKLGTVCKCGCFNTDAAAAILAREAAKAAGSN